MTAGLQDWCGELPRWYPTAQELIAEPDTDGTRTHTAPTSRPPWNGAVFSALDAIRSGAPRLEASLRLIVTGRPGPRRGGSDANVLLAIKAISQLGYALPQNQHVFEDGKPCPCDYCRANRIVARWVTQVKQLPAFDLEERFTTLQAVCHYCGIGKLRWAAQSGRVTCLRYGACFDRDGNHPVGHMGVNLVTRQEQCYWQDGSVTP